MKKSFCFNRHASVDIYLYSDQFYKREPLKDPDNLILSNMRYMPLLDFDLEELKGKKIHQATLFLKTVTEDYPLEVELTTVTQDWDKDVVTYYKSTESRGWVKEGWLSDVIMGNGNSVYYREKTIFDKETGILKVNVPVELVYSLVNRISYGFGIIDCKSRSYGSKPGEGWNVIKKFNTSKSKGPVPLLEVEYDDFDFSVPEGVSDLEAIPCEDPESIDSARVVLNWRQEADNTDEFRYYNIYISEAEEKTDIGKMDTVPRYFTPVYRKLDKVSGTEIKYLKPETFYWFAVTVSNNGKESKPQFTCVKTLPSRKLPALETKINPLPVYSGKVACGQDYSVYVLDEIIKVDPQTGKIYEENSQDGVLKIGYPVDEYKGSLFNGTEVELIAVPGEKTAFQLVIGKNNENDMLCSIKGVNVPAGLSLDFYRIWYLKIDEMWYPEVAIPVKEDGTFSIPFEENKIDGQKFQSLYIDLELAENIKKGQYSFQIEVKIGSEKITLPVKLDVIGIKLDKPDFTLELNGYGAVPVYAGIMPGEKDFEEVEEAYYKTAFRLGMNINIVPYTHTGIVYAGYAPKIEMVDGLPKVVDWSEWDQRFGKYLDGSYTLELCGRKVPISHMYLPIFENWPMPINEYYGVKVERDDYPELVNEHKLKATTIDRDFKPGYREGIKAILKEFIRHIDEKGWTQVKFVYFFNNKHFYKNKNPEKNMDGRGVCWWLLDEPHFRDDWEALNYFAGILREARQETNSGNNVIFRADLSCYNHIFNFLDGNLDLAVVASRVYDARPELCRERKIKFGEDYWVYGGWNSINKSNIAACLWVIDSYLKGGSGMCPWLNYGRDINYEKPAETAGLYPGNRFGLKEPTISLRLKSARKGLEIIKYLETFKKVMGYSNIQLKAYVSGFIKLKGETKLRFRDDAGSVQYTSGDNLEGIELLKRDILEKLQVKLKV